MKAAVVEGIANGPNDRALRITGSPDLQFTASSDDKIATLAWSLDLSRGPTAGNLSSTIMTMSASAELDSNNEATILGLKGFPGGAEVKLNFTHYMARFKPTGAELMEVTEARVRCRTVNRHAPNVDKRCDPYDYEGGVTRFVVDYYPEGHKPMLARVMPGSVWFLGGEFSGNQKGYDYLDQPVFAMRNKSKFGYGGTAFGGVILPSGQTSVMGSFHYARRYEASDPITLCQTINAIPQTQCITAASGPPKSIDRAIASVELRHAFSAPLGEYASFAIAPEFSYDLNNDAYSIDAPAYLVGDGKGKLRGGVRFAYVNAEKSTGGGREGDFSLALFVGVPFSVFR